MKIIFRFRIQIPLQTFNFFFFYFRFNWLSLIYWDFIENRYYWQPNECSQLDWELELGKLSLRHRRLADSSSSKSRSKLDASNPSDKWPNSRQWLQHFWQPTGWRTSSSPNIPTGKSPATNIANVSQQTDGRINNPRHTSATLRPNQPIRVVNESTRPIQQKMNLNHWIFDVPWKTTPRRWHPTTPILHQTYFN